MSSSHLLGCSGFFYNVGQIQRRFASGQSAAIILLLSVIVGILAGLLSTTLELAINYLLALRMHWLAGQATAGVYLLVLLGGSVLTGISFVLVNRVAPEAKGSGIQEIEGVLAGLRSMRWHRVIPVKYFGGIAAIGSGMVLGREGPSVQMGGGAGQMVHDLFRRNNKAEADMLIAAGSAAGLAAAFNAPLAAVMFVIEEMRGEFNYNRLSVTSVILGAIVSTVVYRLLRGQAVLIPMPVFSNVPLPSLVLFFLLGGLLGLAGLLFNHMVLWFLDAFDRLTGNTWHRCLILGMVLGLVFSALAVSVPAFSGDGVGFIPALATGDLGATTLFALFFIRLLVTLICFCSGAPGGFFAPTLALGTLAGTVFGIVSIDLFPAMGLKVGMFAIAGMVGLFTAAVRAPVTGLLLVVELTGSFSLVLPMMSTALGATLVAQMLGGQPIYSMLLQRTLDKDRHNAPVAGDLAAS